MSSEGDITAPGVVLDPATETHIPGLTEPSFLPYRSLPRSGDENEGRREDGDVTPLPTPTVETETPENPYLRHETLNQQ